MGSISRNVHTKPVSTHSAPPHHLNKMYRYLLYERSNFDKNISNFACFNIPILDSLFQVHQKVVTKRFNFQNVFEDFFKILLWHNVWFKNKLSESNIKHVQNCIESFFCGENFSGCKVGFVLWFTLIVTWTFVIVFFWFWPKNKRNNLWFLIFIFSCLIASKLYLLDTIQDFFSNFRIKWQLNWEKNSTFP